MPDLNVLFSDVSHVICSENCFAAAVNVPPDAKSVNVKNVMAVNQISLETTHVNLMVALSEKSWTPLVSDHIS